MLPDPSLVAAPRPEREFAGRWGIYSVEKNRWMEVVFGSEHEANESLKVLKNCKPSATDKKLR
jgi:hypothetical protein